MTESAAQNAQMLALLQAQVDNAKTLKLPKPQAPMPLPTAGAADATAQSMEFRKNLLQRSGLNKTVLTGQQSPLRSAMGVPMFQPAAS